MQLKSRSCCINFERSMLKTCKLGQLFANAAKPLSEILQDFRLSEVSPAAHAPLANANKAASLIRLHPHNFKEARCDECMANASMAGKYDSSHGYWREISQQAVPLSVIFLHDVRLSDTNFWHCEANATTKESTT